MSPSSKKEHSEGAHGGRTTHTRVDMVRVVCIGRTTGLVGAYYSSDATGGADTEPVMPFGTYSSQGQERSARRVHNVSLPMTCSLPTATHLVLRCGVRETPYGPARESAEEDDTRAVITVPRSHSTVTIELKTLQRLSRKPTNITRRLKVKGCSLATGEGEDREDRQTTMAWLVQRIDDTDHIPTILIYDKPDLSNLMRDIPDETSWADLALAGTHDSTAVYGAPYAQCQTRGVSINEQLMDGIRFLDLRMRVESDDLIMYHGYISQRARFADVLSEIYTFLTSHPSESLVVSIKEEVPPNHPDFAHMVWQAIQPRQFTLSRPMSSVTATFPLCAIPTDDLLSDGLRKLPRWSRRTGQARPANTTPLPKSREKVDRKVGVKVEDDKKGNPFWFLDTHVPTLGEVRGKAILLCRFPQGEEWGEAIGWHPSWPDNRREGFEWELDDGTSFRVQDWYDVPNPWSIQEKFEAVTSELIPTLTSLSLPRPTSSASAPLDPNPQPTSADLSRTPHSIPGRALTISFASGGRIPLAPPFTIATGLGWPSWGLGTYGVNHRLVDWLIDLIAFDSIGRACSGQSNRKDAGTHEARMLEIEGMGEEGKVRRIRGIVPLDFYKDADGGSAVVELLAVMNESGLDQEQSVRGSFR